MRKWTAETFWNGVDKRGSDECWPWKRFAAGGYGRFRSGGAHRYAYRLTYGEIPAGKRFPVMHLCNNKLCCNPDHLKLGTPSDNVSGAYRDGLIPLGKDHARAKFSVELIMAVKNDARPQMELERIYGISQTHISRIKRSQTRKSELSNG